VTAPPRLYANSTSFAFRPERARASSLGGTRFGAPSACPARQLISFYTTSLAYLAYPLRHGVITAPRAGAPAWGIDGLSSGPLAGPLNAPVPSFLLEFQGINVGLPRSSPEESQMPKPDEPAENPASPSPFAEENKRPHFGVHPHASVFYLQVVPGLDGPCPGPGALDCAYDRATGPGR